jgi:D-sedoheptulose 7-phosphate isomerase
MMQHYFENLARTLAQVPSDRAEAVLDALWQTYQRDGTVIVCGNGGSAATASHLVCDLGKWTVVDDRQYAPRDCLGQRHRLRAGLC